MPIEARLLQDARTPRLTCALAALFLSVLIYFAGFAERAEDGLTEVRAQLLDRAPTGKIAIVEIDAKSLAATRTWPWSRSMHARLVGRLHRSGASLIAFDVDFSGVSDVAGDRSFAQALREAEPVILPIFEQSASDQARRSAIRTRPAPMFDAAWVGGVNIFPGRDGVVRDYPAALMIGDTIQPSIAALLAESDAVGARTFQPDWAIDAKRIPRFSFVDVLEGRVPPSAIDGKHVIVGATAIELGDRYAVPRFGVVPGVVIQALAAESLLQSRAITRTGPAPQVAMLVLVCLILAIWNYRSFALQYLPRAAVVVVLIAAAPIAVQARWPISVDTVPLWVAAWACIAMRSALEFRGRLAMAKLTDSETGLPNRLALIEALESGDGASVLVVAGIDRFEDIRGAIGTVALSKLVGASAHRIAHGCTAAVFRPAADVLAFIAPQGSAGETISATLDRLLRDPVDCGQGSVDLAVTLGLEGQPGIGASLKIERAVAAVVAARGQRAPWQWYEGADPALRRQLSMMGDLRRGLALGEVHLAFQPKQCLNDGSLDQAEVLVRWTHPTDGPIPPDEFIALAERTGVICELTEFVLRAAFQASERLRSMGHGVDLAINVSAMDISREGFADTVGTILREAGADPNRFGLEVTESAIIRSSSTAIDTLAALRALGMRLSIDDYGTGQSTLSYLKQLPVHELKIDRGFVTSLCTSETDEIMVRSTIDLAHDLGLKVVAEGVEDATTLAYLTHLRCDYAQGYGISRPLTFDDYAKILGSQKKSVACSA